MHLRLAHDRMRLRLGPKDQRYGGAQPPRLKHDTAELAVFYPPVPLPLATPMLEAAQAPLFDPLTVEPRQRLASADQFRGVSAFILDVPESIPKLGYGSHQFFRYYGKFPSVVGAEIVRRHGLSGEAVLDCYAGSGTTLVEAQSAGSPSFGIDINPLAVLASNVKTAYPESRTIRAALNRVLRAAAVARSEWRPSRYMPQTKLDKWFTPKAQVELAGLQEALVAEPLGLERSFLITAFLGIARRVSTAYDGEVRPHVNPGKKARSPIAAFAKKANEMIDALHEADELRPSGVASRSILGDNRDLSTYAELLGETQPRLVVAHPPYLNSFNYLSVFGLEFAWAEEFPEVWSGVDLDALRRAEHRAWPATDGALVRDYYNDFRATMLAAVSVAAPSARVAVVIGDATIRGVLEPVHTRCWDILCELGLEPLEIWFRTTHYGIGKYAYSHRADYHGAAQKKDAILFFTKP